MDLRIEVRVVPALPGEQQELVAGDEFGGHQAVVLVQEGQDGRVRPLEFLRHQGRVDGEVALQVPAELPDVLVPFTAAADAAYEVGPSGIPGMRQGHKGYLPG